MPITRLSDAKKAIEQSSPVILAKWERVAQEKVALEVREREYEMDVGCESQRHPHEPTSSTVRWAMTYMTPL